MYRKILLLLLSLAILIAVGCNNKEGNVEVEEPIKEPEVVEEPEVIEEPEPELPKGKPSKLTGIYTEESIDRRILSVVFDNHPKARWQAGLNEAEIVYEVPVEAPYTRYLGLFLVNDPEIVGPIRSARPYLVTLSMEYDAYFAHVGGSEAAKSDIRALSIPDIDGLTSSNKVFWRVPPKKSPNNLYSTANILRETALSRKYRETTEFEALEFNNEEPVLGSNQANRLEIKYYPDNNTAYEYNEETGLYERFKDWKEHIDESDESRITAKNVLVQITKMRVLDNAGRMEIDQIGEGKGYFVSNGFMQEVIWKKEKRADRTKFFTNDNEELKLNPGVTWVQIVSPKTKLVWNEVENEQ